VSPQRKRVRFTKEFKLRAVKMLAMGQKPTAQLALELGTNKREVNDV
jgi:transposase-like protein